MTTKQQRSEKHTAAQARNEVRAKRTTAEQLKELDNRPGESKRERARLGATR